MSVPAGWYDDGSGRQRWWDGRAWGVYAQDVSPVPAEVHPVGSGQVLAPVARPMKEPGILDALGQAVKDAAVERKNLAIGALTAGVRARREREEREREARRRQEELDRQAGALVTSGVFGDAYIEIFENGYVRIGEALIAEVARRQERLMSISGSHAPVKYSQSLDSRISSQPYEKLLSISFLRGGGSASPELGSNIVGGATMKAVSAIAKGSLKASVPGLAVAGAGYLAKKVVSGKSVLTIATDRQIHTLSNRAMLSTAGIPLIKTGQEDVGEILERVGNSVLAALGRGPVSPSVPALPSGQAEVSKELSSPGVSSEDVAKRLRDLDELRKEGILDDADFLIAKRQLLGRL